MKTLLEQLKEIQNQTGMSDYKFSRYIGVSKQLWGKFCAGEIKRSRKVEMAAYNMFWICPEKPPEPQQDTILQRVIAILKRWFKGC